MQITEFNGRNPEKIVYFRSQGGGAGPLPPPRGCAPADTTTSDGTEVRFRMENVAMSSLRKQSFYLSLSLCFV